ncbi:pentatricopeptide repeat-containing protein At3g16610-like [Malania oleifera]|uniref:pentatricopeptide repeat-containing protein At3g16610-like n=1 Tax=Malania oleifera TaxID=397392 RepID=UPI0025ADC3A1|nr:pentatricopeptide repeat-containing protein At3g16610-like [Malania oleifera]
MPSIARLSIPANASTAVAEQSLRTLPFLLNKPTSPFLQTNQAIQFTNLFSRLKSPPHLLEARRLHALLLLGGFFHPSCSDRVLGSQLVNVYANFGCIWEALLVFNRLPQRSNIAWNAVLRGLVNLDRFSEAIEFYHLMLREGIIPDNYTYPLVLKACSGLSALEEGREVLELMQLTEAFHNVKHNKYVECALIDMFAKCGSLIEARKVFDEMPIRDLASWSAMICGAVQSGQWVEALCLFRRMILEGLQPDSVVLATVLPACGGLEVKQMGMAVQGCIIRGGFESDLYVLNALIDMYCKCGDTSEAYGMFCTIVYKDVVSWSTMISGYAQNCQYVKSFDLFLEMRNSETKINAVIVASVVPAFAKLKLLKQGKEVHSFVLKQGFESDVVVGSALIDMYASCGSKKEAEYIFEIMFDKEITIWNSMIVGHTLNGDVDKAFKVFQRIWGSKLKPNYVTLVSILPLCTRMGTLTWGKEIHAYATRSGMGTVVSVGNCLIDMYCKCGHLELGIKVFDQMMKKNIVTYNTIISAHGIHGLVEEAFSFFEWMKEARIRPNKVTFVALLSACSHAGLIEKGWFFYNSMVDYYGILPEMEHYSCMVDLLGRAGRLDDACYFIRKMPMEPDINVLGSLLGSCRVYNKVELAGLIQDKISQEGLKDSGFYVLLSNIYASIKRWEDARTVRTGIKEQGLIKKPGYSWIQLGCRTHLFHAFERMHPEINKIKEILESLLFEMKRKGYISDSSLVSGNLSK